MRKLNRMIFIGNLWSVTDKDIDMATMEILKRLAKIKQGNRGYEYVGNIVHNSKE